MGNPYGQHYGNGNTFSQGIPGREYGTGQHRRHCSVSLYQRGKNELMKNLLYILFLLPFLGVSQVNMWTYDTGNGGNNDGTLQQSEVQAALDNESNLIVDPLATLNFSSLVAIDQIAVQTIDWNGSTIEKNFSTDYALWINKAGMSGSNTTMIDLIIDGNSNHGSLMFINARTQLTNVEAHSATENTSSGGPRGIYISVTDNVGLVGEWVFDNVHLHDIKNDFRAGIAQPGTGNAQGLQINWPVTVSGAGMQFVMKNSTIENIYGDEADGIIINSPNHDISGTNNTLWFENMTMRNCERRVLKGYIGNGTWIGGNVHAADRTNPNIDTRSAPGGLFNIGAGSSADGAENWLVCGTTFHGGPTTPLDSWETMINIGGTGGDTGVEFRNITWNDADDINTSWGNNATYDFSGFNLTYTISEFKLCGSTIGAASTTSRSRMNKGSGFTLVGGAKLQIDSNNTYTDGQAQFLTEYTVTTEYVVSDLSGDCAACPTHGGISELTGIKFTQSQKDTVHVNEGILNPKWEMQPITTETGESYSYTIETGIDGALFSIVNTDELQYDGTFDYELPVDTNTNNIYGINVKVTSTSTAEFTENLGVYVQDVEENIGIKIEGSPFAKARGSGGKFKVVQ